MGSGLQIVAAEIGLMPEDASLSIDMLGETSGDGVEPVPDLDLSARALSDVPSDSAEVPDEGVQPVGEASVPDGEQTNEPSVQVPDVDGAPVDNSDEEVPVPGGESSPVENSEPPVVEVVEGAENDNTLPFDSAVCGPANPDSVGEPAEDKVVMPDCIVDSVADPDTEGSGDTAETVEGNDPDIVDNLWDSSNLPNETVEADAAKDSGAMQAVVLNAPVEVHEVHKPGWESKSGKWYYYDTDGKLITGERFIDGAWYYLDPQNDGAMATGITHLDGAYLAKGPKTVYYGSDGKMVYGEKELNGAWSYLEPGSGALVRNSFAHLNGSYLANGPKTCYYDADGKMVYGEREVGGSWYYMHPSDGARAESEFVYLIGSYLAGGPKTVYYGSDGKMAYGEQCVAGEWYYLDPSSGARAEDELVHLNGSYLAGGPKMVYYDSLGRMVHGWGAVGGSVWWFNEDSGNCEYASDYFTSEWQRAQGFWSSTPYLILSDYYGCRVTVYMGSQGNWKPLYCWTSSPGAYSTPTVMGTFQVGDRGYSFGHGYTCYYWTQFYGDYLFHSIKYYEGTWTPMDGRLGYNVSQGCVRLDPNNAYWIYKNIPRGTTVYSH